MLSRLSRTVRLASVLLFLAVPLVAQVTVKKGAVIYVGSASNTTAPATVKESKIKEATPEWKKIQAEAIDVDSAQGKQLIVQMNNRIREAIKDVAKAESRDMVTRKCDVTDAQGRDVVDLTDKVVAKVGE
jgi:short-subunit dehydrogenase involved in D-alanine esterification of teichoic acids